MAYVRYVDVVNRVLGYFVMYLTVSRRLLLFASLRVQRAVRRIIEAQFPAAYHPAVTP
jgi:hypothetical protein